MADSSVKSLGLISPRTLAHHVLDRLRQAILDGVLEPGSRLNQVTLAEQLGTSRGTIRAALSKLEEEGLVCNEPFHQSFVVGLSPKSLQDLYGLRLAIEAYAMRLAVPHCTDQDVLHLQHLVKKMRDVTIREDVQEMIACDLAFHRRLVELSGNEMLPQTWSTLQLQLRRYLTRRYRDEDVRRRVPDSHLPLLDAIARCDVEAAVEAITTHISQPLQDTLANWDRYMLIPAMT